ncbi:MAG: YeeE/YedE family protein [Hydrogenophilus sp.]|nr:YeeE/YedE family protein [Hydrogenophilus sp.]
MGTFIIELLPTSLLLPLLGALLGLAFGYFGQQSRFCFRAAMIELAEGQWGQRTVIWFLTFSIAVTATQLAIEAGWLGTSTIRQLSSVGSLSGAIFGGILFGIGMILTRGCASRLLILAGSGNLRSLFSGLIFAVTAQAATSGALAPLREWLGNLWTIPPAERDLLVLLGLGRPFAIGLATLCLLLAILWAVRSQIPRRQILFAAGVGLTIPAAWVITYQLSTLSFDPIPVHSLSFTTPSANLLMTLLATPTVPLDFDLLLIPAVILGSFLAAWRHGELEIQGFQSSHAMKRYFLGAALMGFGGILAGGCAVGAGVSGSALFSLTAWVTLFSMGVGGVVAHRLLDVPAR